MVYITEFRVVMPLTLDEYQIGQLYTVADLSKSETGGGDGVEVLKNEPFHGNPLFHGEYSDGQYTKKHYIGKKKVNGLIRSILPANALIGVEEAWNAFPYCRTIITNEYMKDDFVIMIESIHLPGRGEIENAHRLPPDKLEHREVVLIDIAEELASGDYKKEEDPTKFKSEKTGRGPLTKGWIKTATPCMTCYKLVTVKFKWFGLQTIVESRIIKTQLRLFTLFHRQVFCNLDKWYGLTMADIRELERSTKEELQSVIKGSTVRGMVQPD